MEVIFNLGVIALVLLIAYWWANQGLLSSLLHLLAVISAGAIALGLWEYAAYAIIEHTGMDGFAWGGSLILIFAISLAVLRLITDKTVRSNVVLPNWANLAFGGVLGFCSGILTVGILLLGIGFIQSHREVMGYQGYGRASNTGKVVDGRLDALWFPVEELTYKFYGSLSVGSLYPDFENRPLRHFSPQLHRQAYLVRDSFDDGKGAIALDPGAASIKAVSWDGSSPTVRVAVAFSRDARDFAEQLSLSQAQVRLIEGLGKGVKREARVVHPTRWGQVTADGGGDFIFDDITHYATSVSGRESADVVFEFQIPAGFTPGYLLVRNTRLKLPSQAEPAPEGTALWTLASSESTEFVQLDTTAPDISSALEVTDSVRGVRMSVNSLPTGLSAVDVDDKKLLDSGKGFIPKNDQGGIISRALRIEKIYAPKGTRIVQVDVSRTSPADLFSRVRDRARDDDELSLVDSRGATYRPIGYIYTKVDGTEISIDRSGGVSRISDLPSIPTSGDNRMFLLFTITEGVTIDGFQAGEITVGTCSLTVIPASQM
jgi:hypothetical protein